MSTNSRVFFTKTSETQTDGTNYVPVPMVMIPFELHEAMAKVFFNGSTQSSSSTNVPLVIQPNNDTSSDVAKDSENSNDKNVTKNSVNISGHSDLKQLNNEMNKSGPSSSPSTVASKQESKSQTKKTIPYATDIEKKRKMEKSQQNKSIHEKHPILTTHLTDKKTTAGHTDPTNRGGSTSSKSSDNDDISDNEDMESLCLSKVIHLMNKYKTKERPVQHHNNIKH